MRISPEQKIKSTIRKGSVFYFIEDSFKTGVPHYFIVLNERPREDNTLLLVCVVTFDAKVYDRIDYAINNNIPKETFVDMSPDQCSFLKNLSLVNCNKVFEKTLDVLMEKLGNGKLKICDYLEEDILKRIHCGVKISPLVDESFKKLL